MASEASPICFRVTAAERNLLDAVAYFQGESMSAFVRNVVIESARDILEHEGADAVLGRFKEVESRRSSKPRGRLERLEEALEAAPVADTKRVKRR